jgi:hypothetical protein
MNGVCKTLRNVDKDIKFFVVKSEVSSPIEIIRHTWEKNIKLIMEMLNGRICTWFICLRHRFAKICCAPSL